MEIHEMTEEDEDQLRRLGNVLKYLLRDKGNKKEDLEKAVHYLEKIIEGLD